MQELEYKRYEEIGNWDFSDIEYTVEQDSDWNFYKEISKYSSKSSLILDLGTGGGEKALSQMPDAGMIIATDFSPKMIETANINKKNYPNKKIKFVTMDNLNMKFPNNLFDIITARHTIIDANQIYNCLDNNGILIIEGVDKYDCWELKTLFNRGQAFNDNISISQKDYNDLKEAGFSEINLQEIVQYEYYKTENDLLALLLKTPILDDFSELNTLSNTHRNQIEADLFNKYISQHTTDNGIELKRVLYGIVAKK